MYDLNFFEGQVDQRDGKLDRKLIYVFLSGFFILLLAGYMAYNLVVIKRERAILSSLKQEAEDIDKARQAEGLMEKQIQLNDLKESVDQIKTLDADVAENNKVTDSLLEVISENIPNNIFLTVISIDRDEIYMTGISKDKWAIPEFQKNLESLDDYDVIYVPYITLEDGHYNFSLEMTRGVEEDEPITEEATQVPDHEGTDQE